MSDIIEKNSSIQHIGIRVTICCFDGIPDECLMTKIDSPVLYVVKKDLIETTCSIRLAINTYTYDKLTKAQVPSLSFHCTKIL